jgi:type II secretion system protein H
MRRRRTERSAFTLLELVLVMMVIATVLAMAAPSLRGWHKGSKLKDAAAEFITLTELARTRSVSSTTVHRLMVDAGSGRCFLAVQNGQQGFEEIRDELSGFSLPEGYRIDMTEPSGARRDSVDFFPTGRTQEARVRITSPEGETADIQCATPTEGFRALAPGETW